MIQQYKFPVISATININIVTLVQDLDVHWQLDTSYASSSAAALAFFFTFSLFSSNSP